MLEFYTILCCIRKVKNHYFYKKKRHIVANQTCLCPECKFPADIHFFRKSLQIENTCPMCSKEINPNDLKEISDEELKKLKGISANS